MGRERGNVLRVLATPEDIKKSYGVLSKFYGFVERLEEEPRKRGLELLSVKEGELVLEIGVGTGFSLKEIAFSVGRSGKAYGIDITPEMLKLTEKRLRKAGLMDRVELQEGDARAMPYKNSIFDAVYMAATLELFDTPDIPQVLGEVKRVLKPSGRLSVTSLSKEGKESFWFLKFYEWLHQKCPKYASCRPIYLEQMIRDAGFNIVNSQELVLMRLMPLKLVLAKPG
jgi:demethylmenaquinone methyltransferase/2-methoxy-6-polyprenyl-1,4-benzoquinol methylase